MRIVFPNGLEAVRPRSMVWVDGDRVLVYRLNGNWDVYDLYTPTDPESDVVFVGSYQGTEYSG